MRYITENRSEIKLLFPVTYEIFHPSPSHPVPVDAYYIQQHIRRDDNDDWDGTAVEEDLFRSR